MKNKFILALIMLTATVNGAAQVNVNANQVSIKGNVALPTTTTGFHGTNGLKVQYSDGSGTPTHLATYASDGSLTDGGAVPGIVIMNYASSGRLINTAYHATENRLVEIDIRTPSSGFHDTNIVLQVSATSSFASTDTCNGNSATNTSGTFDAGAVCFVPSGYWYKLTVTTSAIPAPFIFGWQEILGLGTFGGGGTGGISRVFGRTGPNILAQIGDYSYSQISGTPTLPTIPITNSWLTGDNAGNAIAAPYVPAASPNLITVTCTSSCAFVATGATGFAVGLSASFTSSTFSSGVVGQHYDFIFTQDVTGGRNCTYPSGTIGASPCYTVPNGRTKQTFLLVPGPSLVADGPATYY